MNHTTTSTRTKARIVIIDDDVAFGAKALKLLESAGFPSRFHRGPFGSLLAVHEADCDVILLDICMPKLDGNVISRLIQDTFGKTKRIVLCSNMERKALERMTRMLGAHGYLSKQLFDTGSIAEIAAIIDSPRYSTSAAAMAK
jgi:CheY-like chemotaxis protein